MTMTEFKKARAVCARLPIPVLVELLAERSIAGALLGRDGVARRHLDLTKFPDERLRRPNARVPLHNGAPGGKRIKQVSKSDD